jgi:hypothetical protein
MPDDYQERYKKNFERNKAWLKKGDHVYNTPLPPDQEQVFQQWVAQNKVPFDPKAQVTDYDMRGFWQALQNKDPKAMTAVDPNDNRLHYPDYWKTPYHETFSNESQWAAPNAPEWNKQDQLVAPDGSVLFDDRAQKLNMLMQKGQEFSSLMGKASG